MSSGEIEMMNMDDVDVRSFSFFDRIPIDLTTNILTRLPVKSVYRSRAVCKPWRSIVDEPKFRLLHFKSYSLTEQGNSSSSFISLCVCSKTNIHTAEEVGEAHTLKSSKIKLDFQYSQPSFSLVGSSNGLICLSSWGQRSRSDRCLMYICNPTTGEALKLPDITPFAYLEVLVTSGFGFDFSSKEFKVVVIFQIIRDEGIEIEVNVFTLGSNSWRKISYAPEFVNIASGKGAGVFVNGSVHWISFLDNGLISIVSFDLGHEKFSHVPLPGDMGPESFHVFPLSLISSSHLSRLGVLGGCLCLTYFREFSDKLEIWMMKDYNVRRSWTKQFNVDTELIRKIHGGRLYSLGHDQALVCNVVHPVSFRENGEIVLLYNSEDVASYNHVSRRAASVVGHGGPATVFQALPFVRSFIWPKPACLKEKNNFEENVA